jgi:hypothetical protein
VSLQHARKTTDLLQARGQSGWSKTDAFGQRHNTVLYKTWAKQNLIWMNPVFDHWYMYLRSTAQPSDAQASKQSAKRYAVGRCNWHHVPTTANNMTAP